MKYDSIDDGRERLDDLAQMEQCGPYHDWQELIDPNSGGFIRCSRCGAERDCEDPDGDLG